MDTLPVLIFSIVANMMMFVFVGYYIMTLRGKEKELDKLRSKIDGDYHQVVDNALAKERKILDDATAEADKVISDARNISKTSTDEVNKALQEMVVGIQSKAAEEANAFMANYQTSLKQLSSQSLGDFQNVAKELNGNLKKQVDEFQKTLLPGLQKELSEYKQSKMEQAEQIVKRVVLKSSQEILNKAMSLEDHQEIVIAALEKAKKEGVFD
jgi:hypothetical protein